MICTVCMCCQASKIKEAIMTQTFILNGRNLEGLFNFSRQICSKDTSLETEIL